MTLQVMLGWTPIRDVFIYVYFQHNGMASTKTLYNLVCQPVRFHRCLFLYLDRIVFVRPEFVPHRKRSLFIMKTNYDELLAAL